MQISNHKGAVIAGFQEMVIHQARRQEAEPLLQRCTQSIRLSRGAGNQNVRGGIGIHDIGENRVRQIAKRQAQGKGNQTGATSIGPGLQSIALPRVMQIRPLNATLVA